MRIEIKTLLKELPKTSHGQALKEYLDECYKEINDVSTINTIEEAKGKQLAMKTLKKIFAFYNDGTPVDKIPNQYE
jgi:uncharacterized protein YerC